ncbi:MAG: pitrilysin family protein [Peptostreptococcales bacterium]
MIINKRLNNGAELIMEKIPFARAVAIGIWVKTGSIDEDEKNNGISHYIEHMLFKGTEKRSAKDIAYEIDKIGGQINAFTGKETTCYYVKVLDSHVKEGADVLLDIVFNSIFDDEEMEKEKTVIYEEINMYEDSPQDTVHDLLSQIILDGHPLGQGIIGTHDTISNFTRQSVMDYFKKHYITNNMVISVAGNIDEGEIIDLFQKGIVDKASQFAETYQEIPEYKADRKMKKKDIEQAHLCIGTKGVRLDHDEYYPRAILSNIMGGSMSSRMFQKIREEKGLAYSVYTFTTSYVQDGLFGVYAGVNPNQLMETARLMVEELELLGKDGITIEELNTAKEQLKGNYILNLDSVSGRMASIGKSQLLLGKIYTPDEMIEKINKVSMEDMNKIMKSMTDIDQYSVAVVGKNEVDLSQII